MNRLLFQYGMIRFSAVALAVLVPLVFIAKGVSAAEYSSYKAVEYLPYVVIGVTAGVLIDSFNPIRVSRLAIAAHVLPALLVLLVDLDRLPLIAVYLALIILSAAGYIAATGLQRQSLEVLQRDDYGKYQSRTTFLDQLGMLALPVAIGWLAERSMPWSLAVLVGLATIATIFSLRGPDGSQPAGASEAAREPTTLGQLLRGRVRTGWQAMVGKPFVLELSLVIMLINAIEGLPNAFSILFASTMLGATPVQIGIMVAAAGAGGLAAALAVEKISSDADKLLKVMIAAVAVNGVLYLLVWLAQTYIMTLLCLVGEAVAIVFSTVAFRTLRQRACDKESFGFVTGVSGAIVKLGLPPALLLGGLVAQRHGLQAIYLTAGIAEFALIPGLWWWARRVSRGGAL